MHIPAMARRVVLFMGFGKSARKRADLQRRWSARERTDDGIERPRAEEPTAAERLQAGWPTTAMEMAWLNLADTVTRAGRYDEAMATFAPASERAYSRRDSLHCRH
jgi:hypothetical protein